MSAWPDALGLDLVAPLQVTHQGDDLVDLRLRVGRVTRPAGVSR